MGRFIKPGRVVILLAGRYAGKKAVVIRCYDDGAKERSFAHCLVAGIEKAPLRVKADMSEKK
jgi:large subunit ribosomal protein L27e